MFEVRPATRLDAAAWLRMREALWPGDDARWHAAEIEQFFAGTLDMPLEVLVAIDGFGEIIGFAELSIRRYAEGCVTDRVAYLEGWYVDAAHRRRGIGTALVAAAETWARRQRCTEFASDALLENDVSAAAHRAAGFEEVERIRCFRKAVRQE
jgi:aminoglycoside 6'-N-acetyltransferase I